MLIIILGAALLGMWLVLSGHYTPLLISFGVASSVLATWMAIRMKIADDEGVPVHLFPGVLGYVPWLIKEIFVSNVQVARIILSPELPVSPTLVHYRASQETDLGRVIFANSITLTPGTVTTGVEGDDLRIHALAWLFVDGVEEGEMDRRVVGLEGGSRERAEATDARVSDLVDPDSGDEV